MDTDQHVNKVHNAISKIHPTVTYTWKLECNVIGLDQFHYFGRLYSLEAIVSYYIYLATLV